MHAHPRRRRDAVFAGSLVVLLAAWNNAVVVRLPGYPGSYAAANLAATGALLAAARAGGLPWTALGLSPGRLAAGARLGGAYAAVVAAGYGLALAAPALRPLMADSRVAGLDGGQVAYQVLVRIPLGTVLWEEVAFRGVLLAALTRVLAPRAAVLGSAALFGAWHVRPTLSAVAANDLAEAPVARAALVLAGCGVTAATGVLFTWLRLRSGSLLAPVLLHLATNCLGVPAAVLAARTA